MKEIAPVHEQNYSDYFVKKTREYFQGRSRDWQYEIALIVDRARKFKKGCRVLELGCGVGTVLLVLARDGYDCYGVDFDPIQTKNARMLAKEFKIENIRFFHNTSDDLCFKKTSFDVIVSNNLLEHLPDRELHKYFNKVHDMLKSSGIFIIQTKPGRYTYLTKRNYIWLLLPFFFLSESIFNKWLRLLDKWVPKIYKKITGKNLLNTWQGNPPGHCNCHEYENLLKKIQNYGFIIESSQTFTYPWSRYYRVLKTILPFENVNTNIFVVAKKDLNNQEEYFE